MRSVPDLARRRAELSPDAIAFTEAATGRRLTAREFNARADRFAEALGRRGVTAGERIAVLCHNSPTFFEILMGSAKAGVVLVPLNWRQTPAELLPILADCGARLLLHDEATAGLAASLGSAAELELVSFSAYEDLIARSSGAPAGGSAWPTDRLWYLLYTSGTTGKPKAVIQTVGMALANYVNVQQAVSLTEADRTVNFLPLFHTAGINLHSLPVYLAGGTVHVLPKFDVEAVMGLLESGSLTLFFGVPAIYQAISLHPAFPQADLSRVRNWGCGGAPLPDALIRAFLAKGVVVCNGMGMTETGPTVFIMDPAHAAEKVGSVGKPQILAEVRLVDLHGRDVADGERGELLFRGPGVTPGYFNNPEATANAFTPDGWLRSGDVGRRDSDGYYYIVDRIKDMYISGGENVYPAEVEAVLCDHPAVLEAAVIGVADTRWGEVGHAAVRLRPGATATPEELCAHARARLAAYKVPKRITLLDDFPRTAAGKVQKHVLRKLVSQEAETEESEA
ncbi:long-chain fatty acid--CoA ligase [Chelatococcus sp. SYSU_G07232]|uniref:Long-chain fatty acid--CoA ligase n=1 Tax=Chelatococcus albus TaxID=3047466 RepID=A0ABT7AKY8_9HYPH|nr:long-chain fatty acid--CoA ligase [Chelatococcus sp. SYSU_G07232]MDJ1160041.1 long-chain fatty acid--CoA ligase [Chelatococcus sp. SYSU_G07232]